MSKIALGLLLIGSLTLVAARCGEPRPPRPDARVASTAAGSCDGFFDYGDEMAVTNLRIGGMRPLGLGVYEVDLDLELTNLGNAIFRSATAVPDFSGVPELQVVTQPAPLPADFGPIASHGTAWSTASLLVQVPAIHFGDLVTQLTDGTIPFSVYGDEQSILAPGVEVHDWTASEDRMYDLASQPGGGFGGPINMDPGPGPFAPGQEFSVGFLEFVDDAPTVFDEFAPGDQFYLVENPDNPLAGGPLLDIPDAYDRVRVLAAERLDDVNDGATFWFVTLKRTDTESLPSIYSTASFCTGTGTHIDLPVQKSRLLSLDSAPVDPAVSDANPQGIRFNDLPFGGGLFELSGQVQGHVLRPSLSFRIRDGQVSTVAEFDTDIALTAELAAKGGGEVAMEDLTLWSLCFPMPDLPAGPVSIPMNLQLTHSVGVEAGLEAGAVVGFQKHFDSGFWIRCESGGGQPSSCSSDGHREGTPIQLTPPRLTDDTQAHAQVRTTLTGSLNLLSPYPVCDAGPSLFLSTTAHGMLTVEPTQDPWWDLDYGLDVTAGVELDVLGLELARYDSDVFSTTDDGIDSGVGGPRSSGEDQRWAVAIDDTSVPNGVSAAKIAALPDGSSVAIASEAIFGRTPLVKLDRYGAMEWVKEFAGGKVPQRVRALSDGTFVVVGSNAWLARVDGNGNLLWSFDAELSRADYTSGRCALRDVAVLDHGPGHYDFVAVGRMGTPLITEYDACALRVNEDGTMPWSRIYVGDHAQHFYGATATQDGNVAAVGTDYWYYLGTRAIPLVAKLDAATGDPIWWKGLPMTRSAELRAVTEAADGTLFAAGSTGGIIYTTGTSLVAAIAPDGSEARHAEVYQDEGWEALLDFETWTDTAGGDSPYDVWFDIAPSGDGFVVVGNTGLGAATAARAAKINAELGTEWITTFDGALVDGLTGVAPAPDGIFVSGYSGSLPEPDGPNTGENQLWVMKLPFTGALDFLPEAAMTTRWVAPAVRDSSLDPAVNPTDSTTQDGAYSTVDTVIVSSGPNTGLLVAASPYCVELLTESGHATTTDTCPDP